jgi:tetratricopeptide (TPR) repeat protein
MKNFKKSIETCEKLYTMDPKNEILVAIGNYHKMDKNYSKALEVYNKCLELDLDNGTKSFIFSKLI